MGVDVIIRDLTVAMQEHLARVGEYYLKGQPILPEGAGSGLELKVSGQISLIQGHHFGVTTC